MSYCAAQDLIDRYGEEELIQLTDRMGEGTYDAEVVAQAIADSDADIDAYLAARYTTPLSPIPSILVRIGCDLARYYLWKDQASDAVRMRYEDARRLLERIATGAVGVGPAATAPDAAGREVLFAAGSHVWTRDENGGLE